MPRGAKGEKRPLHPPPLTNGPLSQCVTLRLGGAFAEFERSMIRQRVKLGLKRAVAQGKRLGRPQIGSDIERKAQRELRKGNGILKVARHLGLGTGTVHRIKRDMAAT